MTPAAFYVQELGKFYHGAVIAGLLREAMSLAGLELKLPGWDAIRKHLSGQKTKRWTNPTKGGNRGAIALLFLPCCGRRFSLLSYWLFTAFGHRQRRLLAIVHRVQPVRV